jgi:hypothetical protein
MKTFTDASVVFVVLLLILVGFLTVRQVRLWARSWGYQRWPTVSATIQKATVSCTRMILFYSVFEYRFTVAAGSFAGRFALAAEDREDAERLRRNSVGKQLSIRYKPTNPEVSLLAETELWGRQVHQSPRWVGNSDEWPALP